MGYYLNPGNEGFCESVNSKIYVDKTGLIAITNECVGTKQKYICVSRPRRFGKSMAIEMLATYYSRACDSRKLFQGFKIAATPSFEKYLNQCNVLFFDMAQFLANADNRGVLDYLQETVLCELRAEYGNIIPEGITVLADAFREIYKVTKKLFVFLIDEWDCLMRERANHEELQRQYLDFLRGLLKDQVYVSLAYMTGILPIKKYGNPTKLDFHSALNMFSEYSMTDQAGFEEYTGFTEDEVKALCEKYNMDFAEASSWYDGYTLGEFRHVYNPRSVVEAVKRRRFGNYWTSTETYDALKIYIDMDFDKLRHDIVQMLGGNPVAVNTRHFRNDMKSLASKDDVLTLLIHLGYLAYDADTREAFIPNKEIVEEFQNAMDDKRMGRNVVF